jgi:hypothetical protein
VARLGVVAGDAPAFEVQQSEQVPRLRLIVLGPQRGTGARRGRYRRPVQPGVESDYKILGLFRFEQTQGVFIRIPVKGLCAKFVGRSDNNCLHLFHLY